MLSRTRLYRRVPMIQFRYGVRPVSTAVAAAGGVNVAAPSASPVVKETANAPVQVFESMWDLPANLRPKYISDEEMEYIRFGGATPYPPEKAPKGKK